jgi:hypothetical protein
MKKSLHEEHPMFTPEEEAALDRAAERLALEFYPATIQKFLAQGDISAAKSSAKALANLKAKHGITD